MRTEHSVTQNLTVGMRLWGAVLEATPRELIISLPHGLRGHVPPHEVHTIRAILRREIDPYAPALHAPEEDLTARSTSCLAQGAPLGPPAARTTALH